MSCNCPFAISLSSLVVGVLLDVIQRDVKVHCGFPGNRFSTSQVNPMSLFALTSVGLVFFAAVLGVNKCFL